MNPDALMGILPNFTVQTCLLITALKLYGDDLCPSQLQSLAEDLQLAGVERQMDGISYVPQVREEQMVRICL